MRDCVEAFMALDATVTGFSLGLRLFPYIPLGVAMAEQCDGVRTMPGLRSNTATGPIVLKPLAKCSGPVEYERQFMFDELGNFRLVCYFSPDLLEDADTIADPSGRWRRTVDFIWQLVDSADYHRVMLPTLAGFGDFGNNYAGNAFLTSLAGLGYRGAFWSHWRDREAILRRALDAGVVEPVGA